MAVEILFISDNAELGVPQKYEKILYMNSIFFPINKKKFPIESYKI